VRAVSEKLAIPAIGPLDAVSMRAAAERLRALTKPPGSLGRLETLAVRLAGITGQPCPRLSRKVIVICAADHGVSASGVSAYPREVTGQMVANFMRGGAAINVLARAISAEVRVVDMGVHTPGIDVPGADRTRLGNGTRDLAHDPAMERSAAERAIAIGVSLAVQADILCTGDMGIGNTTSGAAIVCALTGAEPIVAAGRGTGIDEAARHHKAKVIARALARGVDPADPIGALASLGGFEIGALAGLILGAAARRIPVVLDGLASGAAALIAQRIAPSCIEYCIAGHVSAEPAHRLALDRLALEPLLNLGMRLGEGTGAALALSLVDAACRLMGEMATFADAGVTEE
jgi:nicotinate-nucleotide--dimethylbenzimidazole phosphoribosyltransferase